MNLWHLDKRIGRELGINGKWADVPSFQIVNDVATYLRGVDSRMINLEYGLHSKRVKNHKDWEIAAEIVLTFHPRLRSFNADAIKAAALYDEVTQFIDRYVIPLEESVKDIAA